MLSNPVYDPYQILTKVYSEGAHLKQAIAETYIEELNRARTVRIVYGVLENDGYLSFCIRRYAPKAPKPAVRGGVVQKTGQIGRGGVRQRLFAAV